MSDYKEETLQVSNASLETELEPDARELAAFGKKEVLRVRSKSLLRYPYSIVHSAISPRLPFSASHAPLR
jgi:hypothetical protein